VLVSGVISVYLLKSTMIRWTALKIKVAIILKDGGHTMKGPRPIILFEFQFIYHLDVRRAVALWLRHYATNRQVAGSIPDGVIGIFQ
jgi:hypothetical protein